MLTPVLGDKLTLIVELTPVAGDKLNIEVELTPVVEDKITKIRVNFRFGDNFTLKVELTPVLGNKSTLKLELTPVLGDKLTLNLKLELICPQNRGVFRVNLSPKTGKRFLTPPQKSRRKKQKTKNKDEQNPLAQATQGTQRKACRAIVSSAGTAQMILSVRATIHAIYLVYLVRFFSEAMIVFFLTLVLDGTK